MNLNRVICVYNENNKPIREKREAMAVIVATIELYISALFIGVMQFVVGALLFTNDPPKPGVGIRTRRMLADSDLRRRTEKNVAHWYFRIGGSLVLNVMLWMVGRSLHFAILDMSLMMVGILAPLLIVW